MKDTLVAIILGLMVSPLHGFAVCSDVTIRAVADRSSLGTLSSWIQSAPKDKPIPIELLSGVKERLRESRLLFDSREEFAREFYREALGQDISFFDSVKTLEMNIGGVSFKLYALFSMGNIYKGSTQFTQTAGGLGHSYLYSLMIKIFGEPTVKELIKSNQTTRGIFMAEMENGVLKLYTEARSHSVYADLSAPESGEAERIEARPESR